MFYNSVALMETKQIQEKNRIYFPGIILSTKDVTFFV